MLPVINSHNSWSRLEEVWLGDVYPAKWYDHLTPEVRDCFYEITERTQEDLAYIQQLLESFDVQVCRPNYNNIDDYINSTGQLIKPEICPRDFYLTVGNQLFAKKPGNAVSPWQQHIDRYLAQGGLVEPTLTDNGLCLTSANCVRLGRDLYFDLVWLADNSQLSHEDIVEFFKIHYAPKFPEYRLHVMFNGGHVDSCFALIKPGLILGSSHYNGYSTTFPGWDVWNIWQPEFINHRYSKKTSSPIYNGKWYLPGINNRAFNDHVIKHALDWVGDYTETYFEVNCLVIDEKNVIIPGENPVVFRALEERGVTAHSVPFRTRTFWDGGMHCITLDIRRQSTIEDFFPERTEQLYIY